MKEKDKIIRVSDIDASLSYGKIYSSVFWKVLVIAFGVSIGILFLGVIGMLILYPITMGEYDNNAVWFIIGISIAVIVFSIFWVLLYRLYSKGVRYVKIRLEDAVILHASVKSIGRRVAGRGRVDISSIKVRFKYNKKRIVKQSVEKDGFRYSKSYNKYVDEGEALIAYSPKYDEVMLIKPSSAESIEQEYAETADN